MSTIRAEAARDNAQRANAVGLQLEDGGCVWREVIVHATELMSNVAPRVVRPTTGGPCPIVPADTRKTHPSRETAEQKWSVCRPRDGWKHARHRMKATFGAKLFQRRNVREVAAE